MKTTSATHLYSVLSSTYVSTPTYLRNRIAGFHADLSGVVNQTNSSLSSNLRIATIGTAPNRALIVQWTNYKYYGYTTGCNFDFQIILNETSNVVDVVYGFMQFTQSSSFAQVGLGGTESSDFNVRKTFLVNDWNKTVPSTDNDSYCYTNQQVIKPVSGTKFSWTPNKNLSTPTFDLSDLDVYPNPVSNILNLNYKDIITNIKIVNLLGQEIINKNVNSNSEQVDMSQLLSGVYIAKISIDNSVRTFKVIKK
ncbi:T9SS type A sorting domain-containing protein [Flavobacterium sp. ANB]|uniref:T9SS type A sorting domain-containing protein n=1 Tax=unclassified Flavobacterium TaxID=196869 RepID=UPI0012B99803|nr:MULTISPECIES: T9SS type A sorting domain-containing protein [unclassified Flavobacterium]MBF4516205.1 T9SS type A sorting domain-containing protein [Flavobacterium sp. ANB]MTD69898.1 T9SS type A sorting domain-containing protein [Flavobacterium sp. LC2016-13]